MGMSLRHRLNDMGIDGVQCETLIKEYAALCVSYPEITMNLFLQQVKDSVNVEEA